MQILGSLAAAALVVSMSAGCGSDDPTAGERAAPSSSSTTSPLVGEWQRTQTCDEIVGLLKKYDMDEAIGPMLAEDGWIPGVDSPEQIKDPSHPCRDAVARKHSHFFTADGQFGSRDENGQQVDDGPYRIVGDDTVVIGDEGTRFHFTITDNDTIEFEPVIPKCAPGCFEAQWSVAVAYPGYIWHRIGS
jgi:hypothetical protein